MTTSAPERVLVDTNVLLYFLRGDTRAERYRPHLEGREVGISFQTLAELRAWAIAHRWGARRWVALWRLLAPLTIYYADDATCQAWAEIKAEGERAGRPVPTADAWVAAPARVDGIPLVTHNRRDFAGIAGLVVISEA